MIPDLARHMIAAEADLHLALAQIRKASRQAPNRLSSELEALHESISIAQNRLNQLRRGETGEMKPECETRA